MDKIDRKKYVVVATDTELCVGCGVMREYAGNTIEVKRMYGLINRRGDGITTEILKNPEQWTVGLNYLFEKVLSM